MYPWEREPGGAERRNIQKQACSGALGRTLRARDEAAESNCHCRHLPDCAEQEQLAAAGALNDEPGCGGKDGVHDHVNAAHDQTHVAGLADRLLEQDREIVDDGVAAIHVSPRPRPGPRSRNTYPPICCISCDDAPISIRRKCCVLPPVKRSRYVALFFADAAMESRITRFSVCTMWESMGSPLSAAITSVPSWSRSFERSLRNVRRSSWGGVWGGGFMASVPAR